MAVSEIEIATRHQFHQFTQQDLASLWKEFRDLGADKRKRRFRSHLVEDVGPVASESRILLDQALEAFSTLEIALACGRITRLSPELRNCAKAILTDAAIRNYYENFYPQLLPGFLRERLLGRPPLILHRPRLAAESVQFASSLRDESISSFFNVVDDYVDEDGDIENLISVVIEPKKFARAISRTNRRGIDDAVVGLMLFLEFSSALDLALRKDFSAKERLEASVLWHRFGYWYLQLGPRLLGVFEVFVPAGAAMAKVGGKKNSDRYITDLRSRLGAIRRLCSGIYRWPLEQEAFKANIF